MGGDETMSIMTYIISRMKEFPEIMVHLSLIREFLSESI